MAQKKQSSGKFVGLELKTKPKKLIHNESQPLVHRYGSSHICTTDGVGYARPNNRSPLRLVVDASEGFIPLWDENVVLRWKFDENALAVYENPEEIKNYVRELLAQALIDWGDAVPVRFSENPNRWDFQLKVEAGDNCSPSGCTLAQAFFPDSGRHNLLVFPKMFQQSRKEQVETITHELGHIFGLRHFFAKTEESAWPSEIFGAHKPFSIMNYGAKSTLTKQDIHDLAELYRSVWSGELTKINGTPIHLIKPFHEST